MKSYTKQMILSVKHVQMSFFGSIFRWDKCHFML